MDHAVFGAALAVWAMAWGIGLIVRIFIDPRNM